nr:MAG TPA: hypothetical protein [Caudoviricetes sp.]
MGQCFLYGTGGGGSGVRVVIKAEAPAYPRENTVWVKSDIAGKKYVFAEAEPEAAEEGMLWLSVTGKGIITAASVYSGGKWVLVDAYMFIGGQWVPIASSWDGVLFENGNQYEDITGGWYVYGKNSTSVTPNLSAATGTGNATIRTNNKIDVTNYKTLYFTGSGSGGSAGETWGATCYIKDTVDAAASVAKLEFQKNNTYQIDVTAITGEYYIIFDAGGTDWQQINLSKVWLE